MDPSAVETVVERAAVPLIAGMAVGLAVGRLFVGIPLGLAVGALLTGSLYWIRLRLAGRP